jgi:HPt (histidine-containing phosphotransfer) domain-containing protein
MIPLSPASESALLTPAAARVLKTLQTYAEAFPGGMTGALTHCRSEILAEQSRLREASASGRWHDAARAAHNLGSIGAMTGLPVLHTTARAAETALRAADTPSIPPALEATRLSVETACRTLSGLIG